MTTRVCAALILTSLVCGCASYKSLGIGEVVALDTERREAKPTLAFEATSGTGVTDAKGGVMVDARTRVIVANERQQLAGTFGLDRRWWVGKELWLAGAALGPFVEVREGDRARFLLGGVLQGRGGVGFTLADHEWTTVNHLPSMAGTSATTYRNRTLLTLSLTGDIDPPLTRAPTIMFGLLIGLMWTEEEWSTSLDDAPFGPKQWTTPLGTRARAGGENIPAFWDRPP